MRCWMRPIIAGSPGVDAITDQLASQQQAAWGAFGGFTTDISPGAEPFITAGLQVSRVFDQKSTLAANPPEAQSGSHFVPKLYLPDPQTMRMIREMSASITNPHQSWGKRLLAFLLWSLLATIFGVCGWLVHVEPCRNRRRQVVACPRLPERSRRSDRTNRTGCRGSFTWYSVRYAVAWRNYDTSRLSVLEDEAIDEPYNATVFKRIWNKPKRPGRPWMSGSARAWRT